MLARLWLRGRKEPGYRGHWGERLIQWSLFSMKFRPIGYMWLSKLSVTWFVARGIHSAFTSAVTNVEMQLRSSTTIE